MDLHRKAAGTENHVQVYGPQILACGLPDIRKLQQDRPKNKAAQEDAVGTDEEKRQPLRYAGKRLEMTVRFSQKHGTGRMLTRVTNRASCQLAKCPR